jgi:membrane-bound lytic murein transglycosylase A
MQAIRAWARNHPEEMRSLLAENPSYVFFSELPADDRPPPGALGVRLTAERSLAVDPRTIPLGAPVFLATTRPSSTVPLQRLMVAQDTGGAIKGEVRADFFWGMGDAAGELAGRMKQQGHLWVLYPVDALPPGVESP